MSRNPAPEKAAALAAALESLPPGQYTVTWPDEQGGAFTLWGKEGTPPDFADGWAIPLVARGVSGPIFALEAILNALPDLMRLRTALLQTANRHHSLSDEPEHQGTLLFARDDIPACPNYVCADARAALNAAGYDVTRIEEGERRLGWHADGALCLGVECQVIDADGDHPTADIHSDDWYEGYEAGQRDAALGASDEAVRP